MKSISEIQRGKLLDMGTDLMRLRRNILSDTQIAEMNKILDRARRRPVPGPASTAPVTYNELSPNIVINEESSIASPDPFQAPIADMNRIINNKRRKCEKYSPTTATRIDNDFSASIHFEDVCARLSYGNLISYNISLFSIIANLAGYVFSIYIFIIKLGVLI